MALVLLELSTRCHLHSRRRTRGAILLPPLPLPFTQPHRHRLRRRSSCSRPCHSPPFPRSLPRSDASGSSSPPPPALSDSTMRSWAQPTAISSESGVLATVVGSAYVAPSAGAPLPRFVLFAGSLPSFCSSGKFMSYMAEPTPARTEPWVGRTTLLSPANREGWHDCLPDLSVHAVEGDAFFDLDELQVVRVQTCREPTGPACASFASSASSSLVQL